MPESTIFKRRIEEGESFTPFAVSQAAALGKAVSTEIIEQLKKGEDPSELVTSLLEAMADLTDDEKRALIAGLDPDISKAMSNAALLADAVGDIPMAGEGLFARAHRTGKPIIGN